MRNIPFPEATRILEPPPGRGDIAPLQVHIDKGVYTSCWRMSWRERWAALIYGRVWCRVQTGGPQPPPIALDSMQSIFTQPK